MVVFSNDTFAANAAGVDFDTIFPTTDEDTLINDLATDNTGDLNTFFNSYEAQGTSHGFKDATTFLWLLTCGPMTAVPLVLFSWAARRAPLSLMGFLQFIAPTITFVIGVLQGEAFSTLRGVSFALIWAGVAVFALAAWRKSRPELRATAEASPAE